VAEGRRVSGFTFASFITTFNRPQALGRSIEALLAQSRLPDALLVVDNGSGPDAARVVERFADPRIVYFPTGENLGSAGGVATGMEQLYQRGYDWIHSVDDDNPPKTADTIERLCALIERNDDGTLGAVAAVGTRWDWRRGVYSRLPDHALEGDVAIDTIGGNSQLTVHRRVIEAIGTPEKAFFFGFYDPLYCLRMQQAGFRLMVDGSLMHQYRSMAGRLNLERRQARVPADPYDSLWRRYYVTRNYIFRMTRTFGRRDLARRQAARVLAGSATAWLRGPRYGARFTTMAVRGVVDGYRGRLGRTIEPTAKRGVA
jgi:GT2 family glycosyltransferase